MHKPCSMTLISLALLFSLAAFLGAAFSVDPQRRSPSKNLSFSQVVPRRHDTRPSSTTLRMANDQDPASELTNTLARLDQQWEIQQRVKPASRWTKLALPPVESEAPIEEEPFGTAATATAAAAATTATSSEDFVYLLEPPNKTIPSCLIVFTGGAGLGTYPQIAYNEFLVRLSDRLNAAVITAPYNVGLDHFALAKETGELCRRAIIYCQDERLYPTNLPTYAVSHSLGAKLSCIYAAATGQNFDGLGLISFNNFSFVKTIGMAKEFAATIRENMGMPGTSGAGAANGMTEEALKGLFDFAEMAVSAVGIDFSPTHTDMERLLQLKFTPELQRKTRLFAFDQDRLENTQDFLNACSAATGNNAGPTVSGLPGTHLTPVYFKLGLEDIPDEAARDVAREATGGLESASFGDADELAALVTEVSDWILGRPPSRKPAWLRERPQIAAASGGADATPTNNNNDE